MTVLYHDYITVELNFDGNLFIFQLLNVRSYYDNLVYFDFKEIKIVRPLLCFSGSASLFVFYVYS